MDLDLEDEPACSQEEPPHQDRGSASIPHAVQHGPGMDLELEAADSTPGEVDDSHTLPHLGTARPRKQYQAVLADGRRLFFPQQRDRLRSVDKSQEVARLEARRSRKRCQLGLQGTTSRMLPFGVDVHAIMDDLYAEPSKSLDPASGTHTAVPVTRHHQLWTDRYRPTKPTHLLCDERNLRDVLRWLKSWDTCVFGKQTALSSLNGSDPLRRPDKRILLLHGPPGFGKTTMAHVLAQHAGYTRLEVNASDDRTGAIVKGHVRHVVTSASLFGKPSCCILDEVDGATGGGSDGGFVRALVDLLASDERATRALTTASAAVRQKRSRNNKSLSLLQRPIICICNDLYAPALRPLRTQAHIVSVNAPSTSTLVKRLQHICQLEGIHAEARALSALSELVGNDWRSSLNTLQMIHSDCLESPHGKTLTFDTLRRHLTGVKNAEKSHISVLQTVFSVANAKTDRTRRQFQASLPQEQEGGSSSNSLVSLINSSGELGKLVDGCFAQYPLQPFNDDVLSKPVAACEWLCWHDCLEKHSYSSGHGQFELSRYLPYSIVAMGQMFAGSQQQPRLTSVTDAARESWARREHTARNEQTIQHMINALPLDQQRLYDPRQFRLDVAGYVIPLVSSETSTSLQRAARNMRLFGLRYEQLRTDDGSYILRLDPPVDKLVCELTVSLPARFGTRRAIVQEMERHIMQEQQERTKLRAAATAAAPSPVKTPARNLAKRDFFGRIIHTPPSPSPSKDTEAEAADCAVARRRKKLKQESKPLFWIRWHEGYSNAVRKDISVGLFLGRFA